MRSGLLLPGIPHIGGHAQRLVNLSMKMMVTDIQIIMQDFHNVRGFLPNTLILPASDAINGIDVIKLESILQVKVIFGTVRHPQVCLR